MHSPEGSAKINLKQQGSKNSAETTLQRGVTAAALTRFGGVLCVVEDQHVAGRGLGGDDARILRHVAGSVHFSLVVDLDLNLDLPTYRPKAAKF